MDLLFIKCLFNELQDMENTYCGMYQMYAYVKCTT